MSGDGARRIGLAAVAALLPCLALVALALGGPVASGDLWWHLSTGRWILDRGALPAVDPFSHTAGAEPWVLQEYGTQVLLALLEGAGGVPLLRVAGALLAVALLLAVFADARRAVPATWAAGATALFATLFALKWELRPHLLSAFAVLLLARIAFPRERRDPGPRECLAVLALGCAWVQLHAEALFVPIFLLAGLVGACVGAIADGGERRLARPARWVALLAAGTLGTLLSPLGLEPHRYALFRRSVPQQHIEEWFPGLVLPGDPRFEPQTLLLFVVVAGAFVTAVGFGLRQLVAKVRRSEDGLPWERLAFLAACALLALEARRFWWLLWFVEVDALRLALRHRPRLAEARALPAVVALLATIPLATTHYVTGAWSALASGRFADDVDDRRFPVHAVDLLEEAGVGGELFHPYEWGGYVGWRLWPGARVFVDGRTVLFEDVIPERWAAERDPAVAREVLAARGVDAIVFKRLVQREGGPVAWRPPGADREWVRAWADALAEVWVRADAPGEVARVAEWFAAQGVPFDPTEGFVELAAAVARPEWRAERRLFPPVADARLGALPDRLHAAPDDDVAWAAAALVCSELRLGRSARHALERALRLRLEDEAAVAARLPDGRGAALRAAIERAWHELWGAPDLRALTGG